MICPLKLIGRSKAELNYINNLLEEDEEIGELKCLENDCAWYFDSACAIINIGRIL